MHSWLSQEICRQSNVNMKEQFECKAISWMELVMFHAGDVGKKNDIKYEHRNFKGIIIAIWLKFH